MSVVASNTTELIAHRQWPGVQAYIDLIVEMALVEVGLALGDQRNAANLLRTF